MNRSTLILSLLTIAAVVTIIALQTKTSMDSVRMSAPAAQSVPASTFATTTGDTPAPSRSAELAARPTPYIGDANYIEPSAPPVAKGSEIGRIETAMRRAAVSEIAEISGVDLGSMEIEEIDVSATDAPDTFTASIRSTAGAFTLFVGAKVPDAEFKKVAEDNFGIEPSSWTTIRTCVSANCDVVRAKLNGAEYQFLSGASPLLGRRFLAFFNSPGTDVESLDRAIRVR